MVEQYAGAAEELAHRTLRLTGRCASIGPTTDKRRSVNSIS